MELYHAIDKRFSIRQFAPEPISGSTLLALQKAIEGTNRESGLRFQLFQEAPGILVGFQNGSQYIALVGPKGNENKIKLGYYGEKLVLTAVNLGLGTCWVSGSYRKKLCRCVMGPEDMLCGVIAVGIPAAEKPAMPRKTKTAEQLGRTTGEMPDWFRRGIEAVQKAPSGMNVQPVRFILKADAVQAKASPAFFGLDIGIAKLHFELGAGTEGWRWAE